MRNTKVLDDDEELKRIFRFSRPLQRRTIVTPSSDAKVHETGDNGRRRDSETAVERDSCRGQTERQSPAHTREGRGAGRARGSQAGWERADREGERGGQTERERAAHRDEGRNEETDSN